MDDGVICDGCRVPGDSRHNCQGTDAYVYGERAQESCSCVECKKILKKREVISKEEEQRYLSNLALIHE